MTTTQINWTKGQLSSYVGVPGTNGIPANTTPPICISTPGQQGQQGAPGTNGSPAYNGVPGVQSPLPIPASNGANGTDAPPAPNGAQGSPYPYVGASLYAADYNSTTTVFGGTTLQILTVSVGQLVINVPGDVPFIMRGTGTITTTAPIGSVDLSNGSGVPYYFFEDTQITVNNFPFFMMAV